MNLTPGERLILLMLSDIYEKVGATDINAKLLKSAILGGHAWAIDDEFSGSGLEYTIPDQVHLDVINILDMYMFLEDGYGALSDAEKPEIEDWKVKFHGFDGNGESQYVSVARFMVEDMGRFRQFAGREFNSHHPVVERALAMYAVFDKIRPGIVARQMTLTEMKSVVDAGFN